MNVQALVNQLGLEVICGENFLHHEVRGGYTSDLLSDVMGNIQDGQVWVTLQTHMNVVAVATLRDVPAVVLVNSSQPDKDMLDKAVAEGLPVLRTDLGAFEISGKIYQLLTQ